MASVSDAQLESGFRAFLAKMGDTGVAIVYKPQGDVAETTLVAAMIGPARIEQDADGARDERVYKRDFTMSRDPNDVYGGIADPRVGDVVSLDGEPWTVIEIPELTTFNARLILERVGISQAARRSFTTTD